MVVVDAAEVISAIEYDRSGDFLATGNKGGRVSIYCRHGNPASVSRGCWLMYWIADCLLTVFS